MTAVLGGGIGGLSAAFYALENPKFGAITLLEASNRVGGWIQSKKSPSGATFEKGPRSIRPFGPAAKHTLELISRLNLSDQLHVVKSTEPAAKTRLIYANEQLHALPNTFGAFFKTIPPLKSPLIASVWRDFKAPKVVSEDESIHSFVSRRISEDVADYYLSSLVAGICAGDAKKISVQFLLPTFFEAEQQYGSICKGIIKKQLGKSKKTDEKKSEMEEIKRTLLNKDGDPTNLHKQLFVKSRLERWSVYTVHDGLEKIPQSLKNYVEKMQVDVLLNSSCDNIDFKSDDSIEITVNGTTKNCSSVVSSLPAKNLASLVQRQHPDLAKELNEIPYVNVGVVNLEFNSQIPLDAFGFLVPPKEKLPILGVIYDSCILSHTSSTVLTVMMGGAWFENYFGDNPTEEHLSSVAVEHVKKILKIDENPSVVDVSILKNCIPQYVVGHYQRVKRIRDYIQSRNLPLALCGSAYDGVGINDVILSAKNAIDDISHYQ